MGTIKGSRRNQEVMYVEQRGQFTFYRSFWDAVQGLPKKDRLPILEAIISYALDGEVSCTLNQSQNAFFALVKPNLDSARKRAASGKHGGSKGKANGKQNESKPEANAKQSVREKEGEIEKENEKEIENDSYIGQSTLPAVCLPLNDGSDFPVTLEMVDEFSRLYPAVDVMQALRNKRGWLISNPKNRKTASGIRRFINAWLSREQDKPRTAQRQTNGGYVHGADRLAQMIQRGDFDD